MARRFWKARGLRAVMVVATATATALLSARLLSTKHTPQPREASCVATPSAADVPLAPPAPKWPPLPASSFAAVPSLTRSVGTCAVSAGTPPRPEVLPPALPLPPPPDAARIRAEVAENPHTTPPAILAFADAWAARMQAAEHDVDAAMRLMAEAERRVGAASGAVPVIQALCLSHARLLAETHPALAPRYAALQAGADAQVIRLAD